MKIRSIICAVLLYPCSALSAHADSALDEMRFGGTWAQPEWLEHNHAEADQFGIVMELLFNPLDLSFSGNTSAEPGSFRAALLSPRPHVGGLANFDGDGTSFGYAGLTWHYNLSQTFFVETGFGMALTNGSEDGSAQRASLGSKVLFHESLAFGVQVTDTVSALFQLEHLSHAGVFADSNRGLTNASVRLGHKF